MVASLIFPACQNTQVTNDVFTNETWVFRMEKVDKYGGFDKANGLDYSPNNPDKNLILVKYNVQTTGDSAFYLALDILDKQSGQYLRCKNVEWNLEHDGNSDISASFTPQKTVNESNTIMKIALNNLTPQKRYLMKVKAQIPNSVVKYNFAISILVNIPLPKLTPHFQFNSLVIAPGETKTNLVTFDDIKPGQSYRIDHKTNNSDFLKDSWVSTTDNIFTTDKNSATWSVAVPASANPNIDDEGVNLYPTFLNTNKLIEFDGNQNGFLVYIAGYTVQSMEVKGGNSVTFGDTAKISVNYIVNGNGTFTPKITPPGVITADMLDIIMPAIEQDITTQYGKRLVKVIYYVFFKKMPTNKNVTFAVGGDITYGKAVPKQLTITLK